MIKSYNRSQLLKASLFFLLAAGCFGLAWLFFHLAFQLVGSSFRISVFYRNLAEAIAMTGICFSGYMSWKRGHAFTSYVESNLFHDLGDSAGGGVAVDHYARQVTGPAYLLSQIFLGGPIFLFRAVKCIRQRLPENRELEGRLEAMLKTLHQANKWQGMNQYPGQEQEILMLAQMKQISFSGFKGVPRFKAEPSSTTRNGI
jgi:hypothetical protein